MYKLGAVNAVYSSATSSYLSRGMGIMASPLCVCVFVAAVCCVVVFDDVLLLLSNNILSYLYNNK